MKKFFLFAAAALMALVGCEKQEQSSLNFADVKQNAKISGTLVYVADKAGAASVETPVAGQRVYFVVAANAYATGAAGNQIFEAITDAQGFYEIVVPTGMKSINGNLKTDLIVLGEGASRIFLQETSVAKTLLPGDAKVEKTVAPIDAELTACQGTAVLKGKVQYSAGIVEKGGQKEDGLVAAPAGVKVSIVVKYDPADALKNRTFVASTIADGSYSINIPVQAAASGVKTEITLSQFEGKYTEEFNGKLLSKDAIYGLNAAITTKTLADGSTTINDIVADRISVTEPTTKTTTFKVKGEIKVEAEELTYSTTDKTSDGEYSKINGVKKGEKAYTNKINGGKFQLELRHKVAGKVESTIIYDLATGDKNGKYEQEVAVYDTWKYDDIEVALVIDSFAVTNFTHYYYEYDYLDGTNWKTHATAWCKWSTTKGVEEDYTQTQNCSGIYGFATTPTAKVNGFFDVTLDGTLKFSITQESKDNLLGCGKIVDGKNIDEFVDEKDKTHTLWKGGQDFFTAL